MTSSTPKFSRPKSWHAENNHICCGAVRVAVVDTPDIHGGVDYVESDANTRLIAAAPDLYDSLVSIVDWLDDGRRVLSDECLFDVEKAREVLKKVQS